MIVIDYICMIFRKIIIINTDQMFELFGLCFSSTTFQMFLSGKFFSSAESKSLVHLLVNIFPVPIESRNYFSSNFTDEFDIFHSLFSSARFAYYSHHSLNQFIYFLFPHLFFFPEFLQFSSLFFLV